MILLTWEVPADIDAFLAAGGTFELTLDESTGCVVLVDPRDGHEMIPVVAAGAEVSADSSGIVLDSGAEIAFGDEHDFVGASLNDFDGIDSAALCGDDPADFFKLNPGQ